MPRSSLQYSSYKLSGGGGGRGHLFVLGLSHTLYSGLCCLPQPVTRCSHRHFLPSVSLMGNGGHSPSTLQLQE